MGFPIHVLLALILITLSIASDVPDLTTNAVISLSHQHGVANPVNIHNDNNEAAQTVLNDSADTDFAPLSRHASAKSGSTTAKTSGASRHNKKSRARARSSKGVSATATSSGTSAIASSSNRKRCVIIKKPCGTTCSPDKKSIGMCWGSLKPKFCYKTKKLLAACPGKKVKMCTSTEKKRHVCAKKVQKKVRCPDKATKRTVCAYPKVAVHSCKKLPPKCAKLSKKRCRYQSISKKYPCHKPKRPCRECFNNTAFKKCKATVTRKVEVPCGGSATAGVAGSTTPGPAVSSKSTNTRSQPQSSTSASGPIPSVSPSVSPASEVNFFDEQKAGYDPESFGDGFSDFDDSDAFQNGIANEDEGDSIGDFSAVPIAFDGAHEHTNSVRCFASLFEEEDCKGAPDFCQLFDSAFDSDRCTQEVCRECNLIKNMKVGKELREYCRDLRASCHFFSRMLVMRVMYAAAVARSTTEKNGETKKCYRNETKTVVVPCNYRLPKTEVCKLGCRVGRCEKIEKKRVGKYCRGHLPKNCYQKCKRKMVKRKVCHDVVEWKRNDKVCKKDTTVKYKCYKNKKVRKPCKGEGSKLCSKLQKVKYVCGRIAGKFGRCTGKKGEKKCRRKTCVRKKCT